MRRSTYLIFINAVVLVVILALMAQSLFVVKRPGTVTSVTGRVWVQHGEQGNFTPLSAGETIKSDDTIKTGANGQADFTWADGTRLRIRPDSNLSVYKSQAILAKKADIRQFRLNYGVILVDVAKLVSPQSKFEIATPTAIASARDSIFGVKVKNGRSQAWLDKGSLKLSSGMGNETRDYPILPGRVTTLQDGADLKSHFDARDGAEFIRHLNNWPGANR